MTDWFTFYNLITGKLNACADTYCYVCLRFLCLITAGRWRKHRFIIREIYISDSHHTMSGVQTLTGEPISRLGTVLRVPVNVQEGNCLKQRNKHFWMIRFESCTQKLSVFATNHASQANLLKAT